MQSSRLVRRDRTRSTVLSKRSAKIRLRKCWVSQRYRRITTRSRTLRPEHGRSETSLTYRLGTLREGEPQRTTRHLDTGPSGYKDGIVELGHAFDNQTHGDESRNPKIDWHGADSFWRTARCHQQTSSRLSQTPRLPPPSIGGSIAWLTDRRRDPTPINT